MKHAAVNIYKGINRHRFRSSPVFEQVADRPPEFRARWVKEHVSGVLNQRYARERIEGIAADVALARMVNAELDPQPWVHRHEWCPAGGMRGSEQESEHDVFEPREGYVNSPEAYQ